MFFRPYLHLWAGVLALSCLVNLLLLGPSMHMLLTYDYVLTSGSRATLVSLLLITAILLLCMWGLDYSRQVLAGRASQRMSLDLQRRAFAGGVMAHNLQPPGRRPDLVGDIRQVRKFLGSTQLLSFLDAPWVPVYLAVEFFLHPLLGWTATAAAIVTFLLALTVEHRARGLSAEEAHHSRHERTFRESVIAGAGVVEAHGMIRGLYRRWCDDHDRMLLGEDEVGARIAFWTTLSKASRMIAQALILSLGAWLVLEQEIGPGVMIVGSIVMTRALAPVEQCISSWRPFVAARRAMGRIRNGINDGGRESGDATPVALDQAALEVAGLAASPPGVSAPVIEGVSFSVRPGEIVQVVGGNGSGKSTLMRVLCGAWIPAKGRVRLGGVDVHRWSAADRGRHVGYLSQPPAFFPGTVGENVSRWENNLEFLRDAVRDAGCENLVNRLPQHLDTPLADGGANLSVGMRQRIGLARAAYGQPALVLLDEPESGLDDDGIRALTAMLRALKERGATIVVASHRADLADLADRILALEAGRPAAYGPKDKFVRRGGPPSEEGKSNTAGQSGSDDK